MLILQILQNQNDINEIKKLLLNTIYIEFEKIKKKHYFENEYYDQIQNYEKSILIPSKITDLIDE